MPILLQSTRHLRRRRPPAVTLVLLLAFTACQPRDPLARTVSASSPVSFAMWQNRLTGDFPADERRRFEEAFQEIRLKIMGDREARGSEAIDVAFLGKINGRPLREALQLGWEAKLIRLKAEGIALEEVLAKNATLQTREGDKASERYLVELHQKQFGRLDKLKADIVETERLLAPLVKVTGRRLIPPDEPAVLLKPAPVKPKT